MNLKIRTLHTSDLDAANEIIVAAFQSSRDYRDDLRLYLAHAPDGWYLAEWEDRPAGLVGVTNYGPLAYVGFMAVHPNFHRKGIGEAMMIRALAEMETRGCSVALLDASAMGEPMYRKLGFVDDGKSTQYLLGESVRNPADFPSIDLGGAIIRLMQPTDLPKLVHFDTPIFGASRERLFSLLIQAIPDRSFLAEDSAGQIVGYIFSQTLRIGPFVALNPQVAEALLQGALSVPVAGRVSFIAPVINSYAQDLAMRYGFEHFRTMPHMRYGGNAHPGQRELIYSLMSFTVG
ncbi:MAG: GNAT family N-acetyltransferase [Chloroflexi bacterium]|nr:GNAT family N-acetyltransferase [Chloroflexota bacterium]